MDTPDIPIKTEITDENTQGSVQEVPIKEEPVDLPEERERLRDFKCHTNIEIKDEVMSNNGVLDYELSVHKSDEIVCDKCGGLLNEVDRMSHQSNVCIACNWNYEEALTRAYGIKSCEVSLHRLDVVSSNCLDFRRYSVKEKCDCNICDKMFIRRSHRTTEEKENSFKCDVCFKSFTSEQLSKAHCCISKRVPPHSIHAGKVSLSCDECDKLFPSKYNLERHMRTHTGERPFFCDVCDKSFSQTTSLVNHKRTHTGERTFSCGVCDKSFSQKSILINHMRTHTGERPFSCNVCDKSFSQKSILINHMRTHTGERPFFCDVCDKSFSQTTSLVNHMRIHTGERPFSCDVCNKSFFQKPSLVAHIRTHVTEKSFCCRECGKRFISKHRLTHHMKCHKC